MPEHEGYATRAALRAGKTIDLGGLLFVKADDGIVRPGDTYIGMRNTVDVYVCEAVENGLLWPERRGYPFNTGEGIKVTLIDDESAVADYVVPKHCLR